MNLEHFSENRYSEKILSPEGPSTLKTSFFQQVSLYRRPSEGIWRNFQKIDILENSKSTRHQHM